MVYNSMTRPLIITAFGTSTNALDTYTHLDNKLTHHFKREQILWTYSSRIITNKLQVKENIKVMHPKELLENLANSGVKKAIIQSLHLFPGKEFHSLCRLLHQSKLNCSIGSPLLTTPQDYLELAEILRPMIHHTKAAEILVLGHGTDHPIWVAYHCLEKILNRVLDKKIYVGVVDKYPDSSRLVEEIAADGVKQICIIPLFLVAGMHFKRDIIGQKADSWQSQLMEKNIDVDVIDSGLGLFPGLDKLIIRHIEEAMTQ